MAKIAVELDRALTRRREHGSPGQTQPRILARGDGWTVADVVCTSGPRDRPFEERHDRYVIAVVLAGSFQHRSPLGRGLMTPGALMLGNRGHCFECSHEHGEGDRCVSFWYEPEYFEQLSVDAGMRRVDGGFRAAHLPALRELSWLAAHTGAGATASSTVSWEEIGVQLATSALRLGGGDSWIPRTTPSNAEARVTKTVRTIDRHPDASLTLDMLAREAGLSRYHFLRTFEQLTGITPHQYVRRARLREAAMRLIAESGSVLAIALDCGFGDVSTFNRAFRTEFGMSPRAFRAHMR
ncbi:MAG TPA: AraC family transcriptional regulator [Vicinamibacterales bacterium]|nr:AraC family transcriptional regulator [Vicinamibacterales bacterium]